MKFPSLLILSASIAAAHVVPASKRDLVTRAEQNIEQLDNEEDFEKGGSGDLIPKSRILTGIGPQQAIDRVFDWDESCTDEGQRKKIVDTFLHIIQLSAYTSNHLEQLKGGLTAPIGGSSPNKDNIKAIFDNDPAYAQMFLGHDNRIDYIKETFDLVTTNAPKPAGERGGNKPGAFRFICNADNHVMNGDESAPYCGEGGGAAQAIATGPYEYRFKPTIEPKYSFELSSSVTFCPKFFDNNAFPNIDVLVGSDEQTLDKLDCAERVLLHEFMHLPWIRNMPGEPDYTGYWEVADFARRSGWAPIKGNPDNYAWLAIYAYFNNNNKGCGADVWPSGEDKPNKKPR